MHLVLNIKVRDWKSRFFFCKVWLELKSMKKKKKSPGGVKSYQELMSGKCLNLENVPEVQRNTLFLTWMDLSSVFLCFVLFVAAPLLSGDIHSQHPALPCDEAFQYLTTVFKITAFFERFLLWKHNEILMRVRRFYSFQMLSGFVPQQYIYRNWSECK